MSSDSIFDKPAMDKGAELLDGLTEPQAEAVRHREGPLLILAAAGSGKTRVITRRVAYLVSQGASPSSIVAITFTNKAAGEMKQRVGTLTPRPVRDFGRLDQPWPTICTFHSLCLRIIRHYHTTLGLQSNFTIYDTSDQQRVIKDAIKMLDLSSTNFPPSNLHATISNAKNQLVTAGDYAATATGYYEKVVARVYSKYQAMLEAAGALDFDDLLLRVVMGLREHPDMLAELQQRFQYILIDEYQDTNKAQYILAHALALKHHNICVVGDPDQSIYAWRGADIRNILDFEKDYPDAKVIKLEQNYRSTKTILKIAGELIARNTQRRDKKLWTENEQGPAAQVVLCHDEHDEAQAVVRRMRDLHEQEKRPWSQMAVFYRINSLSRVIEDALRAAHVPYQIARGVAFYNRKEIKDLMAYLRVVANPADEVSLERIVNTPPRGIGDASIKQMVQIARQENRTLWDVMQSPAKVSGLSTRAVKAIGLFIKMVNNWRLLMGHELASPAEDPHMLPGLTGPGGRRPSGQQPGDRQPGNRQSGDGQISRQQAGGQQFFDYMQNDDETVSGVMGPEGMETELFGYEQELPGDGMRGNARPEADAAEEMASQAGTDEAANNDAATTDALEGSDAADESIAKLLQPIPNRLGVRGLMEKVLKESGLETLFGKEDEEKQQLSNAEELISAAAEFDTEYPQGTLDEYLSAVALVSDSDQIRDGGGAVTLMTLHAAKGLEFPVVAMIGMEEGVLPHSRARGNPTEMEEERRLCFVGITRAQERLIMSKAAYRTIRGLRERTIGSPFLTEMPVDSLEIEDRTDRSMAGGWTQEVHGGNPQPDESITLQLAAQAERLSRFRRGQMVRHPAFGVGKIAEMSPAGGGDIRAVVEFRTAGRKTLMLNHARLEPVE